MVGKVTEILPNKLTYNIISNDNRKFLLFFEECNKIRYLVGDEIKFDVMNSTEFGQCAINPIKISNVIFDELKMKFDENSSIEADVYSYNDGGFLLSYKGFQCFLPYSQTTFKHQEFSYIDNKEKILNTKAECKVITIDDSGVFLTIKPILIENHKNLISNEIKLLRDGMTFIGKIYKVRGYGIFISYKYSVGMLHTSHIIKTYTNTWTKDVKNQVCNVLEENFIKGNEIKVTIEELYQLRYSLIWDINEEPNRSIYMKINNAIHKLLR